MSVDIEIPIDEIEEEAELPSKTYRLCINSGRILGTTDGLDAVNQAIRKAITTSRFCNLIYDDDYGSEVNSMVHDKTSTTELIETVVPELIKDALSQDTRIIEAYDFEMSFKNDEAFISFKVDTIFGETEIKEVF